MVRNYLKRWAEIGTFTGRRVVGTGGGSGGGLDRDRDRDGGVGGVDLVRGLGPVPGCGIETGGDVRTVGAEVGIGKGAEVVGAGAVAKGQ